jgi:hypothetical protein
METVPGSHSILDRLQFSRKELDDPATLRTDHVVVVLVFVIVFVVGDAIAKANFAREPRFRQKLQRTIDRGLADARVFLPDQAIKVFAGQVRFRAKEHVEDELTLRRPLESLLLNMFEKNFLFFSHWLGDLRFTSLP